jgi:outer membrane protein OmpA-like peptidoglycan-associated protein
MSFPLFRPIRDDYGGLRMSVRCGAICLIALTDARGGAEYNQGLSTQRANAVKLYLQTAGVEAARLQATGYGFSRPVAPNDDPLGRAQNRRVELIRQ